MGNWKNLPAHGRHLMSLLLFTEKMLLDPLDLVVQVFTPGES